ncbi:hypothetical protein SUDANB23_06615 (plasmid) [Streptomyces sp. enrichment culture]
MASSPATKLTLFVVLGTAFGVLCIILGVSNDNYALSGAGVLATVGGLTLTGLAIARQRSGR